jgi:hypothetical protein
MRYSKMYDAENFKMRILPSGTQRREVRQQFIQRLGKNPRHLRNFFKSGGEKLIRNFGKIFHLTQTHIPQLRIIHINRRFDLKSQQNPLDFVAQKKIQNFVKLPDMIYFVKDKISSN